MNTISYQNIFPDDVSLMLGDMIPSWCQYRNLLPSHYTEIGRDGKNTRAHRYPRIKSATDSYYPWVFITREYFNTRL